MSHEDLPPSFWGYALETSAFTLNRCPSKSVEKTPYEMWTKGSKFVFSKNLGLILMSNVCLQISLDQNLKNASSLVIPTKPNVITFTNPLNKVFVARSGVFLERKFLSKKNNGSKVQLEEVRKT